MRRWFHVLVACLVLLAVSGAPAMAASAMHVDPCADDCDSASANEDAEHGGEDDDGCPDDGGETTCPPFCHGCACFAPYTRIEVAAVQFAFLAAGTTAAFVIAHEDPPCPPSPGVFHPPRRAA